MALVEIVASNLHAGANLAKLEVGCVVEVDDKTAARWISSGKAKETDKKKGVKLTSFEVATPAADNGELQVKLDNALAQLQALNDAATANEQKHASELAAEKQRADVAEQALAEATKGK
ncbi:hypothetical protein G3M83_09340 [Rouxiella badensis]|uniref:hypothetical protein n=1 Tax=Rouxiella badensis TaxID=1646377 RepID=UPI0013EEF29F|nr:hypothetical protein [Rouxiella badensis]QII37885.1 hypothetical protein G3M83_09340 [Rouxiella badensis]